MNRLRVADGGLELDGGVTKDAIKVYGHFGSLRSRINSVAEQTDDLGKNRGRRCPTCSALSRFDVRRINVGILVFKLHETDSQPRFPVSVSDVLEVRQQVAQLLVAHDVKEERDRSPPRELAGELGARVEVVQQPCPLIHRQSR